MGKIEKPGTMRAAAEDSAFQCLGSSEYAYHDRLVHFSAFLEGLEFAANLLDKRIKVLEKCSGNTYLQKVECSCMAKVLRNQDIPAETDK